MMNCKACKNQIPDDSEFCPFCGNKIVHKLEERLESSESLHLYQSEALLKRAFLFLEEGLFDKADTYIEEVLNREPENAEAYLAKLMIDLSVCSIEDLSNLTTPFDTNINYKRVLRYGDEKLKEKLVMAHNSVIAEKEEENRVYVEALDLMSLDTEDNYRSAITLLESIIGYKDSAEIKERCQKRVDDFENDSIYELACSSMEDNPEKAIQLFEKISFWKDSNEKLLLCRKRNEEIEKKEAQVALLAIGGFFLVACVLLFFLAEL